MASQDCSPQVGANVLDSPELRRRRAALQAGPQSPLAGRSPAGLGFPRSGAPASPGVGGSGGVIFRDLNAKNGGGKVIFKDLNAGGPPMPDLKPPIITVKQYFGEEIEPIASRPAPATSNKLEVTPELRGAVPFAANRRPAAVATPTSTTGTPMTGPGPSAPEENAPPAFIIPLGPNAPPGPAPPPTSAAEEELWRQAGNSGLKNKLPVQVPVANLFFNDGQGEAGLALPLDAGEKILEVSTWKDKPVIFASGSLFHMSGANKAERYRLREGVSLTAAVRMGSGRHESLYGLANGDFCELTPEKKILHAGILKGFPIGLRDLRATRDGSRLLAVGQQQTIIYEYRSGRLSESGKLDYAGPFAMGVSNYVQAEEEGQLLDDSGQLLPKAPGRKAALTPAGLYYF